MLEIRNLNKTYHTKKGSVAAVDDVSLTIEKGTIFGIVGFSGAGKSSLLRCINLLERPTAGQILVNGTDLTALKGEQLRQARLKIGMIFQHFCLISQKTVYDNVAFALKAARCPKHKIRERVDELLEWVGLADKKEVYPAQLSGGQKQRVAIARALANDPAVLLCDEATSALDPNTTKSILQLLKRINKELGITIVLITHEMGVVKEICDRMAVMQGGKIIEQGSVYDVFAQPKEELTKQFVQSVIACDVPSAVLERCEGTIAKLTFQNESAGEGIISDTLQQFPVKGNILHGTIEYIQERPLGVFILELKGEKQAVQSAIEYMKNRGALVEVLPHVH